LNGISPLFGCKINHYYTGQLSNLDLRLVEQNIVKTQFASNGRPLKLVFSGKFNISKEAIELEKHIRKRGAKRFLEDLQ
jgi:putative endonuclease